ncbi:hypothetical protein AMTRI_Chr07g25070 [Amborella trichopoda]
MVKLPKALDISPKFNVADLVEFHRDPLEVEEEIIDMMKQLPRNKDEEIKQVLKTESFQTRKSSYRQYLNVNRIRLNLMGVWNVNRVRSNLRGGYHGELSPIVERGVSRKHFLRIPDFQRHYDNFKSFPSSENLYFGSFTYERLRYGGFELVFVVEHEYGCGAENMCYPTQYAVGHQVINPVLPACLEVQNIESTSLKNTVLMEANEVDAATRFQLDAASRFQLETTGCVDPSVNLGRDMRTNYLQFVHNAGLGREMRSNDSQNIFNAASMIHENPTTNNLQFMHNTCLGREMRSNDSQNMFNASMIHETPTITGPTLPRCIKVPPTLHIPPPTLAIPNFEVPTNGTHGYSYSYSGYGKRVESNHASSYHITHPGSGAHATYGGSRTHSSFLDRAALTTYTSGAHQASYSGESSNYENGFMQSYHRTEEGNMGYSMIGSRGKFYGNNAAHRIYTNGAHQADYNGAPGNNEWSPINNGNHFTLKDLRWRKETRDYCIARIL